MIRRVTARRPRRTERDRRPRARLAITAAALLAALAAAPAALAHVGIEPHVVEPAAPVRLTFTAPNEKDVPAVGLEVAFPRGAQPAVAQTVPGWRAEVRGRTVAWSGGSIPVGTYGLFSALVEPPDEPGRIEVATTLRYADGTAQSFTQVLVVQERQAVKATDSSSRTLATFALGLAAAALALAAGAGFLGLWLWLKAGDPPAAA